MSSFCARSANVTARRARAHDRVRVRVYYYAVYSINTVQYPTGKTKKEGTDSLTLVTVFILYTPSCLPKPNFEILCSHPRKSKFE